MAVIVQYIVIRDGVQKMTFTEKKKADAYDKMLDISEKLFDFIEMADFDVDDSLLEEMCLYIAGNRDKAMSILRGFKVTNPKAKTSISDKSKNSNLDTAHTEGKDNSIGTKQVKSELPISKPAVKKSSQPKKNLPQPKIDTSKATLLKTSKSKKSTSKVKVSAKAKKK